MSKVALSYSTGEYMQSVVGADGVSKQDLEGGGCRDWGCQAQLVAGRRETCRNREASGGQGTAVVLGLMSFDEIVLWLSSEAVDGEEAVPASKAADRMKNRL